LILGFIRTKQPIFIRSLGWARINKLNNRLKAGKRNILILATNNQLNTAKVAVSEIAFNGPKRINPAIHYFTDKCGAYANMSIR